MRHLKSLISICSPRVTVKLGSNTAKLFAQLPASVDQKLDIVSLRNAVSEWDRNHAFPYPKDIPLGSFTEKAINNVPVSAYIAPNKDVSIPTVLLVHGGGFCVELENVHKSLMANIAARVPCHGVLPHYSLSPEAKAPTAISEVTSVLKALLVNPEKYGVTKNLVVVGYSSGGNLVWNAILNILNSIETRKLADKISHLILMSPWADVSMKSTKHGPYQYQQNNDKMAQIAGLEQMRDWYLPAGAVGTEPTFSPIYRTLADMKGMPNTTVITGEIDRLLTDSIETTRILRDSGTPVQLIVLEGQSHNHSAHSGLRDGVFTPEIISSIMCGKPVANMKGTDGLGVTITREVRENFSLGDHKVVAPTFIRAKL